jgi:1,3-beta-glucanosyltransferase GAS1
MDIFASFDNTLGFFIGTEVVNDLDVSDAAPYVKAAALDLKSYRDSKGHRPIPVGYSGADVPALRPYLQNYLACGSDSIDFYGQNQYSWCDPSSFTVSGYNIEYANASGYPIPIFFSETGCNTNPPRLFKDQAAILGPQMNDEWSGAIIYEWSMEENGYGLISYGLSSVTSGTPKPKTPDFTNLQSQWATLNPTGTPIISYDLAKITTPACPTFTSGGWLVHGDAKLPTLLQAAAVTRSSSTSKTKTGTTQGLPTLTSGTKDSSISTNTGTSNPRGRASTGLSTSAKAGIAVGLIFIIVVTMLAAYFLWRRRRNLSPIVPLDLSPEGLEVGSAPPKHEYDSPSISTQEIRPEASELPSSTFVPAELGSPTPSQPHQRSGLSNAAELSTIPATPISRSASPTKTFATTVPRHVAPAGTTSSSWANAPWHSEESPIDAGKRSQATAREVPLLSKSEEEELRQIEAEERRLDAQIAESERIRALKEEKAALQTKKAELLAKKEGPLKT